MALVVAGLTGASVGCAERHADWTRFTGEGAAGFSISFPKEFILNKTHVYQALGPDRDIHGVSLTIPDHFSRGTNLSNDTYISVEQLPSATSCTATLFLESAGSRSTETVGGLRFDIATQSEAGVGNFYDETVFAVANSSPCIAVRYFIHSHNIANYDPGAIRPFDRKSLVTLFDAIRHTLVVSGAK